MAPKTGQGVSFIGFDPPTPPFVGTWKDQQLDPQDSGHVLQEWAITITINYDAGTGVLATPVSVHRDPGSKSKFFVLFPGTAQEIRISLPVGDSTFPTASLGVTTFAQLNAAGFTVDK